MFNQSNKLLIKLSVAITVTVMALALALPALAGGNVGTCDEANLTTALGGGGTVTFSCSGTIPITVAKNITTSTTIDASGQTVVLSGTTTAKMFTVNQDINLTFKALTIQNANYTTVPNSASIEMRNGGTLTFDGTTVKDSTYPDYGTFLAFKGSGSSLTVNITNTTFSNNRATNFGAGAGTVTAGTLNIDNSDFISNTGTQQYGGALRVDDASTATINNSHFISNTHSTLNGGAIRWDSSGLLTISNSEFKDNSSINLGGAVYNHSFGDVTVSNTSFISNTASEGGGIYSLDPLTVTNSDFISNTATTRGGAIYLSNGASSIISNTFSGNNDTVTTVNADGGAIYNDTNSTLTVETSTFTKNAGHGGSSEGGAIFNAGTLHITASNFINNTGDAAGGGWGGGALFNSGSTVITNSTFISNTTGIEGGAIASRGGSLSISGSTFEGNTARNKGGALYSESTITIEQSSFVTNIVTGTAESDGGGAMYNNGTANVTNSTFSGNNSASDSGAIETNVTLHLLNTTIVYNTAVDDGGGIGIGSGSVYITNTIVASNTGPNGPDIAGAVAGDLNNLLSNAAGTNISDGVNGSIVSATPGLDALTAAGNGTMVHPLQSSSPAVNAGTNTGCPTTDQRGVGRPLEGVCDIGAYEGLGTAVCFATLSSATEYSSSNSQAVRDAVAAASSGNTVKVAGYCAGVFGGQLVGIDKNLTIRGGYTTTNWTTSDFSANQTTLDASSAGRVITATADVTIENLLIINGNTAAPGGGIYINSNNTLIVNNSTIMSNTVTGGGNSGGGLYSNGDGQLIINNSTFSNNKSDHSGGGIFTDDPSMITGSTFNYNTANLGGGLDSSANSTTWITNSTFYSNTGSTSGGSIYIFGGGTLTVTNVTVSDGASASGGGLNVASGSTANFINTIIANSVSGGDCVNDGTIGSNAYNLIEDGSCATGTITYTHVISGDPQLGSLQDNGGSTWTMLPPLTSPVMDKGNLEACPTTDQRGSTRPINGCDIGAVEGGGLLYFPIIYKN